MMHVFNEIEIARLGLVILNDVGCDTVATGCIQVSIFQH